ncbi:hypothetical protein [Streptomyces sp. NPDC014806]|uniref:hypothetical protein n=1 Tax=Streptomyces sp. NPDC014806 TaxID=3364920 RepID=UPI0037019BD7
MTTETTAQLGDQARAVQVLAALAAQHPTLPAAYITVHAPLPEHNVGARLDVQLDGSEFEAWREAIDADPASVVLHTTISNTWLSVDTVRDGVRLHLAGFVATLTAKQLAAPHRLEAVNA